MTETVVPPGDDAPMNGWLPIETAPSDTPVLVFDPDEGVCTGIKETGRAFDPYWMPRPASFETTALTPTHWRRLPPVPGPTPEPNWSDFEYEIADAITDSMDMDWTSHMGARAVIEWLRREGVAPPKGTT